MKSTRTGRALPLPLTLAVGLTIVAAVSLAAQDDTLLRNGSFETDDDGDGVPEHWYNSRGASLVARGNTGKCLRLENDIPGRPAHLMQAFSLGETPPRWLTLECAVRPERARRGRNQSEAPAAAIHFLNADYESAGQRQVGPWLGDRGWIGVSAPIRVPAEAREAVLNLDMFGAVGAIELDDVRLTPFVPPKTNLLLNGDFRFGDVAPLSWGGSGGVSRAETEEGACLRLPPNSRAVQAVYLGQTRPRRLILDFFARSATGERTTGQALIALLPGKASTNAGAPIAADDDWSRCTLDTDLPEGARLAAVRLQTGQGNPTIQIRDVRLRGFDAAGNAILSDFEHEPAGEDWWEYAASEQVAPGSPLDASSLLDAPAGKHGAVAVREGRFAFADGTPARFFGVEVRAPSAFPDEAGAAAFAERLAQAGINLVRFAGLDDPEVWQRNLLDPHEATSQKLSAVSLVALDKLCAELRTRGVYYAFELCTSRVLRAGDGIDYWRSVLPGLPLSAAIDDLVATLQTNLSLALLRHTNPHTGLRYLDDSALAFVNLTGSGHLLDLLALPDERALPEELQTSLDRKWNAWLRRRHGDRETVDKAWREGEAAGLAEGEDPAEGTVARAAGPLGAESARAGDLLSFYRGVTAGHFARQAKALREAGLKAPIAALASPVLTPADLAVQAELGFVVATAAWTPPQPVLGPEQQAAVASADGHPFAQLAAAALGGRPVVALAPREADNGWCNPYQWTELTALAALACVQSWDAVIVGEIGQAPTAWGGHVPRSVPTETLAPATTVLNGHPSVVAQLPTAARLFLEGRVPAARQSTTVAVRTSHLHSPAFLRASLSPWLPFVARVRIDTDPAPATGEVTARPGPEETQDLVWRPDPGYYVINASRLRGIAGFVGGQRFELGDLTLAPASHCCVMLVESLTALPIETSSRLLVTAVGAAAQRGMTFVDSRLLDVIDLGKPPMLLAPVLGKLTLKQEADGGKWSAHKLDASGRRREAADLSVGRAGVKLSLTAEQHAQHVELVRE